MRRDFGLLLAELLNLRPDGVERAHRVVAPRREPLLARHRDLEPRLDLGEAQRLALFAVFLSFLVHALVLRSELLEARALDLERALGRGELLARLLPALAP